MGVILLANDLDLFRRWRLKAVVEQAAVMRHSKSETEARSSHFYL